MSGLLNRSVALGNDSHGLGRACVCFGMLFVSMHRTRGRMRSTISVLLFAASASGQTSNELVSEFSDTLNPNPPWSFGSAPSLGGAFTLFPSTSAPCAGGVAWTGGGANPPLVGRGTTATAWTCGTMVLPYGYAVMVPGSAGERSVARLTVSQPGIFSIYFHAERIDLAGATATDVSVRHNGAVVGSGVLANGLAAPQILYPTIYAGIGDVIDFSVGDGGDGAVGDAVGVWVSAISQCGLPAQYQDLGPGCPGPNMPSLGATPPILGGIGMSIWVGSAPASASGFLFGSLPSTQSTPAFGCTVFLDLASIFLVDSFTTDANGSWVASVDIPNDSSLYGVQFMLQAAIIGNGPNPAILLSRGLLGTLGCCPT